MSHPQLDLTLDQLLSTTRAVRKRLDLDREVPLDVLKECLELAVQAPTGSNSQGWQFVLVTDKEKKARIGEYYRQAYEVYRTMPAAIHNLHKDSPDTKLVDSQSRSASSADFLGENMGRVPAMLIPCITGRTDGPLPPGLSPVVAQAPTFGSIIPAVWSFMLAARARGIGTAWSTLHLMHEKEVAVLLGIPYEQVMQVALIPIGYTKGTDFKPAYRPPLETVLHVNAW
ncbi:MAG: nitroreductase [Alphaproteobacteria bacterium]|nr:nitroreductase [Alphaproteobacteria bacterium]